MADGIKFDFGGDTAINSGPSESKGSFSGNSNSDVNNQGTSGGSFKPENHASAVNKTRGRGRPALPRDENGNIIRDGSSQNGASRPQKQSGVDKVTRFRPNDSVSIAQQIQGMHAAVATLTKQPVFLLNDVESKALSKALCDVLDYHEINLTEAGGAGALYLALGLTVFGIYKPRLDYIKRGGQGEIEQPATRPASRGEANAAPKGMMDFTSDVNPSTNGQSLN